MRGALRVGIDPNWSDSNFGLQTSYVNGYTEDVLVEMARYSGMEFELIKASWDNLLEGLKQGRYDAVITTLPPYEYNVAKYDFSENLLDLGPILITPVNAEKISLESLEGDLVGIIVNAPTEFILAKHPTIIIRSYASIPDLLDAVAKGEIDGALMDRIPAFNYVTDLYNGVLQIVDKPLTNEGIHLVGRKGEIGAFNKHLISLRKKSTLSKLKKKWDLGL